MDEQSFYMSKGLIGTTQNKQNITTQHQAHFLKIIKTQLRLSGGQYLQENSPISDFATEIISERMKQLFYFHYYNRKVELNH